jgi:hypothetical protein
MYWDKLISESGSLASSEFGAKSVEGRSNRGGGSKVIGDRFENCFFYI